MPWKETQVREERLKFIAAYLEGEWTMSELCRALRYALAGRPAGKEEREERTRRLMVLSSLLGGGKAPAPNDVWCADFKGWFRTGDGRRCEPLTISDECSRFLLTCRAVERPDWEHTYPLFHRAFCAYGVPRAIRTTTGPRLPAAGWAGCRAWRCGGSSWASARNGSRRASPSKTGATSACTRP